MDYWAGLIALLFLGVGLVCLFNKDLLWERHVQSARSKGLREDMLERTTEWENRMSWYGVGLILFSIFLFITFFVNSF